MVRRTTASICMILLVAMVGWLPARAHTARNIGRKVVVLGYWELRGQLYHRADGYLTVTNKTQSTATLRCRLKSSLESVRLTAEELSPGESTDLDFYMKIKAWRHSPPKVEHCHVLDA